MIKPSRGGRPRKGHLEQRGRLWWCQLTVKVDGESVRRWFNLHTEDRSVAEVEMAELNKSNGAASISSAQLAMIDRSRRDAAENEKRSIKVRVARLEKRLLWLEQKIESISL
jgi:hypothetical protein